MTASSSSLKALDFPMVLLRLAHWFLYQFLANSAMKVKNHGYKSPYHHHHLPSSYPTLTKYTSNPYRKQQTIVCDIHGCLLRSNSFFPYFMLVAFEGGSIIRAFLLLLSFCGLRLKDMESVSRAVLPKFYLENLNLHAYEAMESAGKKVVLTSVPRVLVERFLKEYLSVDTVVGTELHTVGKFFTGFISSSGLVVKHKALKEFFGDQMPDIGIGSSKHKFDMQEAYVVNRVAVMPRSKYPKPLVFHDGRLAFLPTPTATLAMFLWLPFGILLAIFRLLIGICLPYKIATPIAIASGVEITVKGSIHRKSKTEKGVLYVCTHRTLLDPVFLSTVLRKPLTAVTYSLLRFSSLFAELADEIVPVAMDTRVTMFYGTTASGLKWLDPIFFLMNPRARYSVHILGKLPRELTCAGGKSSHDVANYIQRQLADALGFECTTFTRRDKYLMLAGNEGLVNQK